MAIFTVGGISSLEGILLPLLLVGIISLVLIAFKTAIEDSEHSVKDNKYLLSIAIILILIGSLALTTVDKNSGGRSKAKSSATDCASLLSSKEEELGTPNETACESICSSVKNKDLPVTQEAKENGVTTAYKACLAGKPKWIK